MNKTNTRQKSKAVRASDTPYAVEVEAGKSYLWCTCGQSGQQPLCDGSHSNSEFVPLRYQAEATKTIYMCGCKETGNAPFCDGSHQFANEGGRDKYY